MPVVGRLVGRVFGRVFGRTAFAGGSATRGGELAGSAWAEPPVAVGAACPGNGATESSPQAAIGATVIKASAVAAAR